MNSRTKRLNLLKWFLKSASTLVIRRHELMRRYPGFKNIGNEFALQGLFLHLTALSKYHNS
ncbi:replication endonuclease [Vibrio owensii]